MKILIEKAYNGFILRRLPADPEDFELVKVVEEEQQNDDMDGTKTDTMLFKSLFYTLLDMMGEHSSKHDAYRLVIGALDNHKDLDLIHKVIYYGEAVSEEENDEES